MFTADAKTLSRIEPTVRRVAIIEPNAASARLMSDLIKGLGAREIYVESDEERAAVYWWDLVQQPYPSPNTRGRKHIVGTADPSRSLTP